MMRLRSLEISDFRKFDRPVRLEGLADGINVLAEPNEFGKSTLLAAIKAVLFERHRAKGKVGERMQHYRNATSPVLRLGFELADGLHHIEKRFMHREPYARLTLPDGTRIEGDVAEERLQALLGFGPPGKQGATSDSVGLWGALWVAQQEAIQQPALQDTGRATLHACLEAELGTMAGGDRGGALGAQVRSELSSLLDGFGRPKGRLKEVIDQLATTEVTLEALRAKRTALEGTISELARLRRELSRTSDGATETKLGDDLADARKRRDTAVRHRDVLKGAVIALELAERKHADATAETKARVARREAIHGIEKTLAGAVAVQARRLQEQQQAEMAQFAGRDAVDKADAAMATAAQALRRANEIFSLVLRADQVTRLSSQLDRALEAQKSVSTLRGQLAAHPATAERLQAVTAACGALERAQTKLDALATEVELDLERTASDQVQLAGNPLPHGLTVLRLVDSTTIDIAGVGRIRIKPAIRDRSKLLDDIRTAQTTLRDELVAIGATDPAEAAIKAARRTELARQLADAEAALKAEAPGDVSIGLASGLEALRRWVEDGQNRLTAELQALQLHALPAAAEAQATLHEANAEVDAVKEAYARASTALAGPAAEHSRAAKVHGAAVAQVAAVQADLGRLQAEEASAVVLQDDSNLANQLDLATIALKVQRTVLAELQDNAPVDTVEAMEARIKRLEEVGTQQLRTVRHLREEIVRLEGRVANDEAEGLDEQIIELEVREGELAAEQATLRREVAMLTLLRDTLATAERDARERYVAPVLRRMTPYLQRLFPGVEVALGDDLQITEVTRQSGPEAFGQLSDGTMEQVAVLLRLAYADLLLEQGKPAMLILDDALAYSDRDRLELIFDVLTRASERMQVLVLTCRADAFSRLGGNRVALVQQ